LSTIKSDFQEKKGDIRPHSLVPAKTLPQF